jgi:hypothetical protein
MDLSAIKIQYAASCVTSLTRCWHLLQYHQNYPSNICPSLFAIWVANAAVRHGWVSLRTIRRWLGSRTLSELCKSLISLAERHSRAALAYAIHWHQRELRLWHRSEKPAWRIWFLLWMCRYWGERHVSLTRGWRRRRYTGVSLRLGFIIRGKPIWCEAVWLARVQCMEVEERVDSIFIATTFSWEFGPSAAFCYLCRSANLFNLYCVLFLTREKQFWANSKATRSLELDLKEKG